MNVYAETDPSAAKKFINTFAAESTKRLQTKPTQSRVSREVKIETNEEHTLLTGFQYKIRLMKGGRKARRVFVCKYDGCEREFGKAWNFLDHARMHEGSKPYSCAHCGKDFTQKGNMLKHLRLHEQPRVRDRKVHACEHCGKSYTQKYNLKNHLRTFHGIQMTKSVQNQSQQEF
uniref:C2H2-type domain-containing protein n=1 Tax=Euplotes harpa TaxID=151035 RepID=A0A7S3J6J6_9SPIT|mmetsp:Transcript_22696/g.26057  ORF Transcript_22696/g.26057 Transcript_22696/m.26057 type:complete len:174 (+) Transcript_22696:311-832(+)